MAVTAAVRTWPFRVYSFPGALNTPQYLEWSESFGTWILHPHQALALDRLMVELHDGRMFWRGHPVNSPKLGDIIRGRGDFVTFENLKRSIESS